MTEKNPFQLIKTYRIISLLFFASTIVALLMVSQIMVHAGELCKSYCNVTGTEYFSYEIGTCMCIYPAQTSYTPDPSQDNFSINFTTGTTTLKINL